VKRELESLFVHRFSLAILSAHIHLLQRSFWPAGTTLRGVPSGFGFIWIPCPNYMFETFTWIGILLVSNFLSWQVCID